MQRSAHGFWLEDAGPVTDPQPPLTTGDHRADVLVIGGGYLGMWTAWRLAERGADVLLCESRLCGHGPSGRNGGFVNPLWDRAGELRELFGTGGALAVCRASATVIEELDRWSAAEGADIDLVRAPMLEVAASEGQRGAWSEPVAACRALGAGEEVRELDEDGVAAICAAPAFREGVLWTTGATVHPGRLALALRAALVGHRRVRVAEGTPVVGLEDGDAGIVARTDRGAVVTARAAALCINHASTAVAPLRGHLSVASSHVVATEPVPDVLDRLGWTGGEGIADCRTMLHYLRTTRDRRIVFGWGGGRMGFGSRRRKALDDDHHVQDETVRHLRQLLPMLSGRRLTHAWGGPIDVSPVHLPWFGTMRSVHYGFGFTGNGVGPAVLGGRILADLVAGIDSDLTALPIVGGLPPKRFPPEPLRFVGGSLIRGALVRVDDADQEGRRPDPFSRAAGALPKLLGLRLPR